MPVNLRPSTAIFTGCQIHIFITANILYFSQNFFKRWCFSHDGSNPVHVILCIECGVSNSKSNLHAAVMPVLSMLRIAADSDKVPPEVLILVKDLAQHARRHIRKVCCMLWSVYICSFRAPEAPMNVHSSEPPKSGLKSTIILASNLQCQTRVSRVTDVTCAKR